MDETEDRAVVSSTDQPAQRSWHRDHMNTFPGQPVPLMGLVSAAAILPRAAPSKPRIVVRDLDGTHMGIAVSWWRAQAVGDSAALDLIKSTCPASDALRSGLEVVLAQAGVLSTGPDDADHLVLARLAAADMMTAEHRQLAREISAQLAADPETVTLKITPVPVSSLMSLVQFLAGTVWYQQGTPVSSQLDAFSRMVLFGEGLV